MKVTALTAYDSMVFAEDVAVLIGRTARRVSMTAFQGGLSRARARRCVGVCVKGYISAVVLSQI